VQLHFGNNKAQSQHSSCCIVGLLCAINPACLFLARDSTFMCSKMTCSNTPCSKFAPVRERALLALPSDSTGGGGAAEVGGARPRRNKN
jgi:hypothetical protein